MDDLKYCQNCEEANPPDAKFCAWCGAKFVSAAASPPDTASSGSPSTRQPPSSPPESQRMKYQKGALLFVALSLVALVLLGIVSSTLSTQSPAYTFKTGITPPNEVNDLITHNGTVALLLEISGCPPCNSQLEQKFADLQKQYPGVAFAIWDSPDNTSVLRQISSNSDVAGVYGVTTLPTALVIRDDGAVAVIPPTVYNSTTGDTTIDLNVVQSAIADAQAWQQSHPTPSPTTAGYNAILERFVDVYNQKPSETRPFVT